MGTIYAQIKKLFIFENMDDEKIHQLTKNTHFEKLDFHRGDIIYSPKSYEKKIGFILSGECEIRNTRCDGKVILNSIKDGGSFGILAVFKNEAFPTEVYAKKNTTVLFLEADELERLCKKSSDVSLNIIKFLADKVSFLNQKISTVTKTNVEKKLASYLISRSKECGSCTFEFNIKKCAETISCGRASVYRALNSLKYKGYIEAENKFMTILNIKSMEDLTK